MRIVNSLDDTLRCPNCGTLDLHWRKNNMGRDYLFCSDCHEEIYENEMTCSEEPVINIGKAPDSIDDSLMELEYEIGELPRLAHSINELEQMEKIRNIFYDLISVIRRMK